jgi:hypothetical protein
MTTNDTHGEITRAVATALCRQPEAHGFKASRSDKPVNCDNAAHHRTSDAVGEALKRPFKTQCPACGSVYPAASLHHCMPGEPGDPEVPF